MKRQVSQRQLDHLQNLREQGRKAAAMPKLKQSRDGRAFRPQLDFDRIEKQLDAVKATRDEALDAFEQELSRETRMRAMRATRTEGHR